MILGPSLLREPTAAYKIYINSARKGLRPSFIFDCLHELASSAESSDSFATVKFCA